MVPARLLVWMVALMALLMPPGMAVHAMAPSGQAASLDCPGHVPPPCPDHDTAKHAAGDCCPLMAGAVALLPTALVAGEAVSSSYLPQRYVPSLAGRLFAEDPPPPRH